MENKFEKLSRIIESSAEIVHKKWVDILNDIDNYEPKEDRDLMLRSGPGVIWYNHEKFALKAFFIENDAESAKQHFYICGCLDEFLIRKYDSPILDYGINHLSYTLLSDCKKLIERYANLRHNQFEKMINNGSSTATYVLQCIIKDDWEEYERAMEIMKTKTIKKFPALALDLLFYEALGERNKVKVEAVLAEFVTPKVHKRRNKQQTLVNEFISHPALGYAKLAWLKGIKANVESALVPKGLLPIHPLVRYENEYGFLNRNN